MSGILTQINLGSAPDAGDGTAGPRAGGAIFNAAIASLDTVDTIAVASSRAIADSDNRAYLHVDGATVTLTWPDTLADGHACTVVLTGAAELTIAGSGAATFEPTGVVVANDDGDLTAVVVIHTTGGAHLVIAPRQIPSTPIEAVNASRSVSAADDGKVLRLNAGALTAPTGVEGGVSIGVLCPDVSVANTITRGTGAVLNIPPAGDTASYLVADDWRIVTLLSLGGDAWVVAGPASA